MTAASSDAPDHAALRRRLEGLNLYLVGMMGAGKSAVARPLAKALGYRVIDADNSIEAVAGCSIPAIFAEQGEAGFRALETAVLGQIASWHSLVVATGGGVVTRPENWGHMQQGVVIWLDAPEELLLQRLRNDPTPRPLLEGSGGPERLRELLLQRLPLYGQADLQIEQHGEAPEAVAARVLAALPGVLKTRQAPPATAIGLQNASGQSVQSFN
ncbi:MAG: shikimate kinase [Cyanobacteriota bacterium]|nr:shikimate kinase [Cyanobacteriota bacterium]